MGSSLPVSIKEYMSYHNAPVVVAMSLSRHALIKHRAQLLSAQSSVLRPNMAAAPEASHQFGSIFFGQRGGVSQGQLKLTPSGVSWRRSSGGKAIEVKKEDIDSLHWMRVSRGCQLSVRVVEGVTMNFIGFREKDLEVVSGFCQQHWSMDVKTSALAVSGRNWGNVAINGKSLMFLVDGKVALEVPLPDVAQAARAGSRDSMQAAQQLAVQANRQP
ncbi:FACT complex subunit SSRP1, partial [Haematococcus lacustris]